MQPISLTIKGFRSFRDEQHIDFEALTKAHLFGIFGATGSGKSSILEAISFALYGNIAGLKNIDLINLSSTSLRIEYHFRVGAKHYRFTVTGERNKKDFGKAQPFSRSAYEQEDGQWKPLESNTAESILKLSYDNFKRTTIIPQGKFMEFLHLTGGERTSMLQELFNLNKYDLTNRIKSLWGKTNNELANVEGQLLGIGNVDAEAVEDKQAEMEGLKQHAEELKEQLAALDSQEKEMEALRLLVEQQSALLIRKESYDRQAEEYDRLEHEVVEYEQLSINLGGILKARKDLVGDIDRINRLIDEQSAKLASVHAQAEAYASIFEEVKAQFEKRDLLSDEADDYEGYSRSVVLEKECESVTATVGELTAQHEARKLDLEKQVRTAKEASAKLQKAHAEMPDLTLLSSLKDWFVAQKAREENILKVKKEVDAKHVDAAKAEASLKGNVYYAKFAKNGELLSEEQFQQLAGVTNDDISDKLAHAERELLKLQVKENLENYISTIHDGEACPLCGSLDHPNVLDKTNVAALLQEANAAVNQQKLRKNNLGEAINQVGKLYTLLNEKQQQHAKVTSEHETLQQDMERYLTTFAFDGYVVDDKQRVRDELVKMGELQKTVKTLTEELKVATESKDRLHTSIEAQKRELEGFREKLIANQSQVAILRLQIKVLEAEQLEDKSASELNRLAEEKRVQYNSVGIAYEKAVKTRDELGRLQSELDGGLKSNQLQLQGYQAKLSELSLELMQKQQELGITDLTYAETVLAKSLNVSGIKAQVAEYRKSVGAVMEQLQQVARLVGGRDYSADAHRTMKELMAEHRQQQQAISGKLGALTSELADYLKRMEELAKLALQKDTLCLRLKDLDVLTGLFKGRGFVNFVATIYLQNLVKSANERFFKMTNQNLSLELDSDNSFLVRDYLNEGRTRPAKTLSGGQTFQASLAMALALADSLPRAESDGESFFFLDEGFGSLDGDSLAIVMQTLKSLRRENRIVGVISHVDEMKEEIPTHIRVVLSAEHGSVV